MEPLDSRAFAVEKDPFCQLWRECRIPRSIEAYFIFLVDLVARMSEPLGEIAVVCEKEQTFCLRIESADVEEPRELWRQQIENRIAHVRIFSR